MVISSAARNRSMPAEREGGVVNVSSELLLPTCGEAASALTSLMLRSTCRVLPSCSFALVLGRVCLAVDRVQCC